MKEYFKVTPAVFLLFRRGDQVLFLRRANTVYMDGYLSLPAGHVDGGEPAIIAAIREAKEEVGVELQADDLKLVHTQHRQVNADDKGGYDGHERIDLFFEVIDWQGETFIAEPDKCSELVWYPLGGMPADVIPEVRSALDRIAAGKTYSDYNFS